MNKPGIFAAIAVAIIGAIAIWAAVTWSNRAIASEPYAPSFGAQIEPSSIMAHTHGLPAQRITDYSFVFPVGP
jgi:hypothetical protein